MEKSELKNSNQRPNFSFEELEKAYRAGKYKNIQIFLSRTRNNSFGQEYLMVTKDSFGIVRVNNVDFCDGKIYIDIEDPETALNDQLRFDIIDNNFKYLFVNWGDIKQMVYQGNEISEDSELLEFE